MPTALSGDPWTWVWHPDGIAVSLHLNLSVTRRWTQRARSTHSAPQPTSDLDLAGRVDLVAGALRATGTTDNFAPS